MFPFCLLDRALDLHHSGVSLVKADLLLRNRRADVAGDVQVVAFLGDSLHSDALGVAILLLAELVRGDDLGNVFFRQLVLAFAFHEVLGGVDEEYVVGLLALLQDEDAHRDAGGVEQVRGQADDGVDMAVLEQLLSDACLGSAAEEPLGDLLDDGAELGVPVLILLAQLVGAEIDLGEQALEGALEGLSTYKKRRLPWPDNIDSSLRQESTTFPGFGHRCTGSNSSPI